MGGFSSLVAMYMDELTSLQTGQRMIYAGISAGADFSYASAVAPQDQIQAAFGSRTVGMIAGKYDEFFFNKSDAERVPPRRKYRGPLRKRILRQRSRAKDSLDLPRTIRLQRRESSTL